MYQSKEGEGEARGEVMITSPGSSWVSLGRCPVHNGKYSNKNPTCRPRWGEVAGRPLDSSRGWRPKGGRTVQKTWKRSPGWRKTCFLVNFAEAESPPGWHHRATTALSDVRCVYIKVVVLLFIFQVYNEYLKWGVTLLLHFLRSGT